MLPFSTVTGERSVSFLHVWPGRRQGILSESYATRRHKLVLKVEIPKFRTRGSEARMWWAGKVLPALSLEH